MRFNLQFKSIHCNATCMAVQTVLMAMMPRPTAWPPLIQGCGSFSSSASGRNRPVTAAKCSRALLCIEWTTMHQKMQPTKSSSPEKSRKQSVSLDTADELLSCSGDSIAGASRRENELTLRSRHTVETASAYYVSGNTDVLRMISVGRSGLLGTQAGFTLFDLQLTSSKHSPRVYAVHEADVVADAAARPARVVQKHQQAPGLARGKCAEGAEVHGERGERVGRADQPQHEQQHSADLVTARKWYVLACERAEY